MFYMKHFMLEVVSENLMLQRFNVWHHLVHLCNKNKTGAFLMYLLAVIEIIIITSGHMCGLLHLRDFVRVRNLNVNMTQSEIPMHMCPSVKKKILDNMALMESVKLLF